ncbi:hypothetical protein O0L34_g14627 [Tuta absoluta]|nr:hypothetical protein O0L34_g14627 [Tuta absoluta]
MSSRKAEDVHIELLNKLLSDSGYVCARSPHLSEESEEEVGEEVEEEEEEEYVPEEHFEVEHYPEVQEEEVAEEISEVFPSPSLRRLIPERTRRVEAFNRIKVLPEPFNTDINPLDIPKINYTAPKEYIYILAEMTGCKDYKKNYAEYWFLDTLANLLRRAQEDDLDKPTQAVLLLWFCEWIKEMQHFDAATRERMLRRWKEDMMAAAKVLAEDKILPNPKQAGVFYKIGPEIQNAPSSSKLSSSPTKSNVAKGATTDVRTVQYKDFVFECALNDLTKIIHYIYDLFGTDFQYELVRSIFTFGPDYHHIQGPFQIELPKQLYSVKKEPKIPKAKTSPSKKGVSPKGRKKEPEAEEYLKLAQLIDLSRQQEWEEEVRDREEWNRRNSILPLNFSVTPEFFEQYWPTPVEEPPPPPPAPTPAAASKKKQKKK